MQINALVVVVADEHEVAINTLLDHKSLKKRRRKLDSLAAGAANDNVSDRSTIIVQILFRGNAKTKFVTVHPGFSEFVFAGRLKRTKKYLSRVVDPRIEPGVRGLKHFCQTVVVHDSYAVPGRQLLRHARRHSGKIVAASGPRHTDTLF